MTRIYLRRRGLRKWQLQATFRVESEALRYLYRARDEYPDHEVKLAQPRPKVVQFALALSA